MYAKQSRPIRMEDDVVTCFRDGIVTLRKNRRTTGFTESTQWSGYQGVRQGDLVIHVMDAFAGAIGVSDSDGKSTPVYSVCTAKIDINNYYYAYILREMARTGFIQSLYRGIRERSSDFRFEVFAGLHLPLPPREEQDQIVRYLDWKVSQINKLINAKRRQIMLLEELKQSIVIDVIQNQNEFRKIKHFIRIRSGDALTNSLLSNDNTLYPVFGGGKRIGYYTQANANEKNILIGRVGANCGCITVPESKCWATDNALIVKTEENIAYIAYLLSAADLNRLNESNAQPLITGSKVLNHTTSYTSNVDEQQNIVTYLDIKCTQIDNVIEKLNKEIILFIEFRTRLNSDVVAGKLDVRNVAVPEFEVVENVMGDRDAEDGGELGNEE